MRKRKPRPSPVPNKGGHCFVARKRRHSTKKSALGAAGASERMSGYEIRIYHCPHCRDWHLTKQPSRIQEV